MRSSQRMPQRSLAFKAHALSWAAAGLASALYIGWSHWDPAAPGSSAVMKSDRDGSLVDATLARLSSDVRSIHDKLAANAESAHALLGRVSALEEKAAFVAAAVPAASAPPPPSADREPPATRIGDAKPKVAAVQPRSSEITTGAIMQRASAPAADGVADGQPKLTLNSQADRAPTVTAPKPALGIQLSSAANLDALRLNWSLLSERHREVLGQLQTRYRQAAGKPNAPYQLIAGPVRSQTDAARICKALAGSGVTCRATAYTGEAL